LICHPINKHQTPFNFKKKTGNFCRLAKRVVEAHNQRMGADLSGVSSDELRMRNYRAQLQAQDDLEVRELQNRHNDEIQRLTEQNKAQTDQMRHDYEVRISQEGEALDERLQKVRLENDQQVAAENQKGQEELNQARTSNQQRVDEYKKNSDAKIEQMRKQYQLAAENLHDKAKKNERREREVSGV
jgi:hypothetical protein